MISMTTVTSIIIAYLFGSLSSAIIVCRLFRLPDPRTEGSQNPGATNVLRIGGKVPAILTLLGDTLKGVIPVLIAKWLGMNDTTLALVAFAAFIGHLYPIFFGFTGGKGVATLIGCLLALSLPTGLAWLATWLLVALLFRYSSLAALTATLLAPIYIWYFTKNGIYVETLCVIAVFVFVRHKSNIVKLMKGEESKIGRKKSQGL